jgi:hypothetical protein
LRSSPPALPRRHPQPPGDPTSLPTPQPTVGSSLPTRARSVPHGSPNFFRPWKGRRCMMRRVETGLALERLGLGGLAPRTAAWLLSRPREKEQLARLFQMVPGLSKTNQPQSDSLRSRSQPRSGTFRLPTKSERRHPGKPHVAFCAACRRYVLVRLRRELGDALPACG